MAGFAFVRRSQWPATVDGSEWIEWVEPLTVAQFWWSIV